MGDRNSENIDSVIDDLQHLVVGRQIEKKRIIDRPHLAEKIARALGMDPVTLESRHEAVLRAVLQGAADLARSRAYAIAPTPTHPDEHPDFQAAAGAELLGLPDKGDGPDFEDLKDDYCRHVGRAWYDIENDPENRAGPGRIRRLRAAIYIKQSGKTAYENRLISLKYFESVVDDYLSQLTDVDREELRAKELTGAAWAESVSTASTQSYSQAEGEESADSVAAVSKMPSPPDTQEYPERQRFGQRIQHNVQEASKTTSERFSFAAPACVQKLATVINKHLTEEKNWQENNDPFRLSIRWDVAPDECRAPWHTVHADTAISDPIPLDEFQDIAAAYLAVPSGRLVILGRGGAGKSTLAIDLARSLLTQGRWQELSLLPVVVKLARWAPERQSLIQWIFDQTATEYPDWAQATDFESFRRALIDKRIVPILDGFDEVDLRHRVELLTQIGTSLSRLVLLSRYDDYLSTTQVGGRIVPRTAAIVLRDLSFEDVEEYLQLTTGSAAQLNDNREKWRPIIAAIHDGDSDDAPAKRLANFVATPLVASIIRTSYSETDADPSELLTEDMTATHEQLLTHLSFRFVQARYELHFRDLLPTSRATKRAIKATHWLSHIAAYSYIDDIFGRMLEFTPRGPFGWLPIQQRMMLAKHRLFRITAFLGEAHQCGILRWNGYSYEFRHHIVLDGLARADLMSTSSSRRNRQNRFLIERNMLVRQMTQSDMREAALDKLKDVALMQHAIGKHLNFVLTMKYVHGYYVFFGEPAQAITVLDITRKFMLLSYKEYLSGSQRFNLSYVAGCRHSMIVAWHQFVNALMMYGLQDRAITQQKVLLRIIERSRSAHQVGDVADVKRHLRRLENEKNRTV